MLNVEFENIKFFMDFIKKLSINSFEIPFIEELNYTFENEFKINFDTIYLNNLSNIKNSNFSSFIPKCKLRSI